MKNTFPGYYKPTETELKRLWDNSIIVLDSKVLLNLYRYSAETNAEIINTLEQFSDRLWIPYNSAQEYHENRLGVIEHQEESFIDLQKFLEEMQGNLKARLLSDDHSFLADQLIDKVVKIFYDIRNKLQDNKEEYLSLFENDELKKTIGELLTRKVGPRYTEEQLAEIYRKGNKRAENDIPPGINSDEKLDVKKYHDLIIWMQTIDKAKATYKPILFLSDKKTDNWWLTFKGKKIGPRPELVDEMRNAANVAFYMYRTDPFMQSSQKFLDFEVKKEAIEEVQKFRVRDDKRVNRRDELAKKLHFQRETVLELSQELEDLANKTEVFSILDISKALKKYKTFDSSAQDEIQETTKSGKTSQKNSDQEEEKETE